MLIKYNVIVRVIIVKILHDKNMSVNMIIHLVMFACIHNVLKSRLWQLFDFCQNTLRHNKELINVCICIVCVLVSCRRIGKHEPDISNFRFRIMFCSHG